MELDYTRNCATKDNSPNWVAVSKPRKEESARKAFAPTEEEAIRKLQELVERDYSWK